MHKLLFALANTAPAGIGLIAVANEFHVSADKPIRIPYGEYPYGSHKMPNGRTVFVTQRFDRAAAESWQAELANELARGGFGYPIYHGHPDAPEVAAKYPDKRAKGWGNRMEIGDDAAELFVAWNEDPGKAFAYFSPYWVGPAVSQNGSNVTTHMVRCKSIALTNDPNIREFRLPNESAATEDNNMNEAMKKFLCELLKLDPATTTDEQLQKAMQTLAEENASLKAAADAAKAEATQAQTDKTTAEAALANERGARIDLMLIQAVADGRVTPAGKTAWEKNLKDDFGKFSVALANEKPAVKTTPVVDPARRAPAAQSVQGQIVALVNEAVSKGMSRDAAFAYVKETRKDLFALPA